MGIGDVLGVFGTGKMIIGGGGKKYVIPGKLRGKIQLSDVSEDSAEAILLDRLESDQVESDKRLVITGAPANPKVVTIPDSGIRPGFSVKLLE